MGVRRSDTNLQSAVSRAVGDLLREGRIAAIFEKYRVPFYPPLIDRRG
jgi:ABC-type amino acid transport substrate-binding protein